MFSVLLHPGGFNDSNTKEEGLPVKLICVRQCVSASAWALAAPTVAHKDSKAAFLEVSILLRENQSLCYGNCIRPVLLQAIARHYGAQEHKAIV